MSYVKQKIGNQDEYDRKTKMMDEQLLFISNALSAQLLDYQLRAYPERSNVMLMIGRDHEQMMHITKDEISSNLHLSDDDLKELSQSQITFWPITLKSKRNSSQVYYFLLSRRFFNVILGIDIVWYDKKSYCPFLHPTFTRKLNAPDVL